MNTNERHEIVDYCYDNIGCSYDHTPSGGVEHESYNCSYLSYCAYRYAGLEIPTWQGHQNGEGSQSDWVRWAGNWTDSINELAPGDLVFFGSDPYDTFHVGIYVGNGMMIDSVPAYGVSERPVLDQSGFVGGGWPFEDTGDDIMIMPTRATIRLDHDMNVRDYPSLDGNVMAHYNAGETVNIDGIVLNDGYAWGHYIGASSKKDRYVALAGDTMFGRPV